MRKNMLGGPGCERILLPIISTIWAVPKRKITASPIIFFLKKSIAVRITKENSNLPVILKIVKKLSNFKGISSCIRTVVLKSNERNASLLTIKVKTTNRKKEIIPRINKTLLECFGKVGCKLFLTSWTAFCIKIDRVYMISERGVYLKLMSEVFVATSSFGFSFFYLDTVSYINI